MKKRIPVLMGLTLLFLLSACNDSSQNVDEKADKKTIDQSSDRVSALRDIIIIGLVKHQKVPLQMVARGQ